MDPYDMTDEELEAAFAEAKAELDSPETGLDDPEDLDTSETYEEEDETTSEEIKDEVQDQEIDEIEEEPAEEVSEDPTPEPEADKVPASNLQDSSVHSFKANGKEYSFTEEEMRKQFPRVFGQAMDYTRKMQAIKPWRKTIDAVEQAKLSHEDINLMIDAFSGNKDAITEVIQRTGVDVLDIDPSTHQPYTAKDYGRDDRELNITEVIDSIKHDREYSTTHAVLSQAWDEASWNTLSNDPQKITALHNDVKSGLYAQIQPIADKLKVFDNGRKSDLDYYLAAGAQYFQELEQEQLTQNLREFQKQQAARISAVKSQEDKRNATKKAVGNRKAATLPAKSTQRGGIVDYLNASDEDFDEWLKELDERD